jgi:hypothetical protein
MQAGPGGPAFFVATRALARLPDIDHPAKMQRAGKHT